MDFSQALLDLKAGHRRARAGWNGAKAGLRMFVVAGGGDTVSVFGEEAVKGLAEDTELQRKEALFMFVDGDIFPYTPTRVDLFSDDWVVA